MNPQDELIQTQINLLHERATRVATAAGYTIEKASPYEIGLLHNGRGIKTWWISEFNGAIPSFTDSKIIQAIEIYESMTHEPDL